MFRYRLRGRRLLLYVLMRGEDDDKDLDEVEEGGGEERSRRLRAVDTSLVETDDGTATNTLGSGSRLVNRKGVVTTADDGAGVVL